MLLFLLQEYSAIYQQSWNITAAHIHPMFPGWTTTLLKPLLSKHNIPYTIVKQNIYRKIKDVKNKCFSCSRERRKRLLDLAGKLDTFNIALAHHKEDVVETLLLNIFYTGRMSTLMPKQPIVHGRFYFVRPIYYLDKETILGIARVLGLKSHANICPYYKNSRRETVRGMLSKIKKKNPDIYTNIFGSIFNTKKAYMPS